MIEAWAIGAICLIAFTAGVTAFVAAIVIARRKVNREVGMYKTHLKYHPRGPSRKLHL
jgi:hypothetical protein